ncbi:MAG: isoaspartyl peptidase/L-asparaginase [Thermoplasmata archaeon]
MKTLILHGGAGNNYENSKILEEFGKIAIKKESPLDAVVEGVRLMEDDIHFNAGTGSNMRIDGSIQMDASVATVKLLGSVINIEKVKNPVLVARDVALYAPHYILSGDGAIDFARKMGHELYDPKTEKAEKRLKETLDKLKLGKVEDYKNIDYFKKVIDTVGAVARFGTDFAGAVSTGGTSLMLRGRVGDVPIYGAGIYVGLKGAIVNTGVGEEIVKRVLAHNIYTQIGTRPLKEICSREIAEFGSVPVGVIAVSESEECALSNQQMPYSITMI